MKKLLALLGVTLLAGCQMPLLEGEAPDEIEENTPPPMEEEMVNPPMEEEMANPPMEEEGETPATIDAEINAGAEL
jgi:hypothetical protein